MRREGGRIKAGWCTATLRADQDEENEEDSAVAAGPSGHCLFHFSHRWSSTVSRPAARS